MFQVLNSIRREFKNGFKFYPTQTYQIAISFHWSEKKIIQIQFWSNKKMCCLTCGWRILKFFQNQSIHFPFFPTFLMFPKWLMANEMDKKKPRYLWYQTNSVQYYITLKWFKFPTASIDLTSKDRFQFILTICIWVSSNQC